MLQCNNTHNIGRAGTYVKFFVAPQQKNIIALSLCFSNTKLEQRKKPDDYFPNWKKFFLDVRRY